MDDEIQAKIENAVDDAAQLMEARGQHLPAIATFLRLLADEWADSHPDKTDFSHLTDAACNLAFAQGAETQYQQQQRGAAFLIAAAQKLLGDEMMQPVCEAWVSVIKDTHADCAVTSDRYADLEQALTDAAHVAGKAVTEFLDRDLEYTQGQGRFPAHGGPF